MSNTGFWLLGLLGWRGGCVGVVVVLGVVRLRRVRRGVRARRPVLRPLRQIIEPVNCTLKSQLGLERHRGRTRPGVAARILQRILALTAAIRHNQTTQQPGPARSLIAHDH